MGIRVVSDATGGAMTPFVFAAAALVAALVAYIYVSSSAMAKDWFRRFGIFDASRSGEIVVTRTPATYRSPERVSVHLSVDGSAITLGLTRAQADKLAALLVEEPTHPIGTGEQ